MSLLLIANSEISAIPHLACIPAIFCHQVFCHNSSSLVSLRLLSYGTGIIAKIRYFICFLQCQKSKSAKVINTGFRCHGFCSRPCRRLGSFPPPCTHPFTRTPPFLPTPCIYISHPHSLYHTPIFHPLTANLAPV